MRVLYLGNYRARAADGRSYNTEEHIARDLEHLGHTVDRMQEPSNGPDGITGAWLDRLYRRSDGYDLFLWTRTWGLPEAATETWRRMEANGTVTASYHLDLYYGLKRADNVATDPFWTTGHVFTPDGNEAFAGFCEALGINHHWSPPAVVSDECVGEMLGEYRPELAHDVVFVGSAGWPTSYHEEWPWRTELLAFLETTYGERFRRYDGLTGHPTRDGGWHNGPIRGHDLNDLYVSAKVVVGDSCFAHPGQRYWSDRPFETYGRGGFLLFPRIDALAEMIGPYPSYTLPMTNTDGLVDIIDLMVDFSDDWPGMVCDRVAKEHTYKQRLAAALGTMGLA